MFGKNLALSPTKIIFLLVLKNVQSLSGSDIVKQIKSQLGEEWKPTPGATYKILSSLQDDGYIFETTGDENIKDQRIRTYSITDKGKNIIPEVSSRFSKVLVFMNDCCPGCCDTAIIMKINKEENKKE